MQSRPRPCRVFRTIRPLQDQLHSDLGVSCGCLDIGFDCKVGLLLGSQKATMLGALTCRPVSPATATWVAAFLKQSASIGFGTPAASDKQTRTELNRWFLIVADSVDAIAAVCCSPLPTGRGGHC